MNVMQFGLLSVVVLLVGFIGIATGKNKALFALLTILVNSLITTIPSIFALGGDVQSGTLHFSHIPGLPIDIRVDKLSAWFILIINVTSLNGALFGLGYMRSYQHLKTNVGLHWIFYVLFHISMVWVCMFQNGIMFLISWELMSLSSLMLVIFEYQNKGTLRAGINYMVQMHISVIFLTAGFIWLFSETGFFNLEALAAIGADNHAIWIFIIFFIGFAVKAGFLPFHTWLPHAHPAAPSHVSGVMSGVIVKLGIYGIFRIISYVRVDWLIIGEVVLNLSIITALYGILNAAVQFDMKRSLAFCTIENIGLIGVGMGLGLIGMGLSRDELVILGFGGALLHTLNHSLFKSLLFFSAGSIYQQTHTRNIEKLGGLIRSMPYTATFFLIGALAIGGLPPFNGFISEFLIYTGLIKGLFSMKGIAHVILLILSLTGMVLVGGMSIIVFTKLFGIVFLGQPRTQLQHPPHEVSFVMKLPQYIIIILMVTIAVFPQFYFDQVGAVVASVFPTHFEVNTAEITAGTYGLTTIGQLSFYFLVLVVLVFLTRFLVIRKRKQETCETWGCGYVAPIPAAQYTGGSFARTFANLFGFITREHIYFDKIPKIRLYPGEKKFATFYFDLIEKLVVNTIVKRIAHTLNYFQFIQNGKIQSYVLYGLFFVIIVFIGTALGIIS